MRSEKTKYQFLIDQRGVSVALTHVLTMGITAVLISGLIIAASGVVDTQQERAVQGELTTIGERLVTELTALDRVASSTNSTMTVETSHPEMVVNSRYQVQLISNSSACQTGSCLVLDAQRAESSVIISIEEDINTINSTVSGGEIRLVHDGAEVQIEGEQR